MASALSSSSVTRGRIVWVKNEGPVLVRQQQCVFLVHSLLRVPEPGALSGGLYGGGWTVSFSCTSGRESLHHYLVKLSRGSYHALLRLQIGAVMLLKVARWCVVLSAGEALPYRAYPSHYQTPALSIRAGLTSTWQSGASYRVRSGPSSSARYLAHW